MKFIILLILVPLILFSSLIKAEPNKLFLELMNEPVDRLTYGLFRCDLLLEKRESLVNSFYEWSSKNNKDLKVEHVHCDYDKEENKIILFYAVLDKGVPAIKMTNQNCKEFVLAAKKSMFLGTNQKKSDVLHKFLSKSLWGGSAKQLDVDIIDNLDNHISIHVGDSSGGHRCEGNLKNDKILYTK